MSIAGKNLKYLRKLRGWTQEDLSARTGLAVVQISRIERGKREIRLTTLIRLLSAFDVDPEDLLRGLIDAGEDATREQHRRGTRSN